MRAVIYARVSSEKQDVDLSISAQLKALREYASKNGYQIAREFIDEAESGRTSARPSFREMISLARKNQGLFDTILVWKYSRFARSRHDSIVFKTLLGKNGVKVLSITEPFDDTPGGKLLEGIIESFDEYTSASQGEDIVRGMRESASRGFYVASHTPYGYRRIKVRDGNQERPKLEVNSHKATVVSSMFCDVLNGKGLKEIVKELNNSGIASPTGRGWIKTTVYKILTNEAYTGTLVWGISSKKGLPPIRVENAWPAIVSRDDFDKVQGLLKSRAPAYLHPKRTASHFLLSGIAKCGYCGKAMVGHDAKSGKFGYYVCGTLLKKGAGACQAKYLNAREFESIVIEQIKKRVLTEENLRQLVNLVNEEMDAQAQECRRNLDSILEEIDDVNKRLDRLYDVIETGKLSLDDLSERIHFLKERKDSLQTKKWQLEWQLRSRKVELADVEIIKAYVEELRNLLNNSTLIEKKSFIRSFVKGVTITGDKVQMEYILPLLPDGITTEEISVLSTVHYGGANITFPHPIFCSCSPLLSNSILSPTDTLTDFRSSVG